MPAKSRACGSGLGSMTLWIIAPQRPHHGMVIDRKVTRPLSTGSLVALKHPQLETDPWERIAGSPRGLESSLKIRLLQNHIWNRVAISCKVFNSIPTRIKQNHPRRTHKKTYLKKWLPMSPCQEAKGSRGGGWGRKKKTPGLNRIFWQTHASCNNPQQSMPNASASRMPSALFWVNVGHSIFSVVS